jgi:hypothetical protein
MKLLSESTVPEFAGIFVSLFRVKPHTGSLRKNTFCTNLRERGIIIINKKKKKTVCHL